MKVIRTVFFFFFLQSYLVWPFVKIKLGYHLSDCFVLELFFLLAELLSMEIKPYTFTYSELKSATQDFNLSNKLGEGGFGPVYKARPVPKYLDIR